ncbi:hypothetical protein ACWD46_34440, partial [Streptomyces sp. NPDC002486]
SQCPAWNTGKPLSPKLLTLLQDRGKHNGGGGLAAPGRPARRRPRRRRLGARLVASGDGVGVAVGDVATSRCRGADSSCTADATA